MLSDQFRIDFSSIMMMAAKECLGRLVGHTTRDRRRRLLGERRAGPRVGVTAAGSDLQALCLGILPPTADEPSTASHRPPPRSRPARRC